MRTRNKCIFLHETLNALETYLRHEMLKLAQCEVEMDAALAVEAKYAITGYDAQYAVLAQSLNTLSVMEGSKLQKTVLRTAFSVQEFLVQ